MEYLREPRPRLRMIGIVSCIIICLSWAAGVHHQAVTISICDVGQGDAILIQTREKTALIDCGSDNKNAARVVRYLLQQKKPDIVIATHHHSDHINGLYKLVSKNYWITEENAPEIITLNQSVILQRLTPAESFESKNENNHSLVYLLKYKKFKMILPGDAEKELETSILAKHPTENLDVDVLKVGHHGSKTSSTESWMQRIKPEVSIVSVASANRYHHPNQSTIMRLERYGKVYRTDRNKTVTIIVDAEGNYQINTK